MVLCLQQSSMQLQEGRSLMRCRPRLCFVGPFLGGHPGYVYTPGETLACLFEEAGYSVLTTSSVLNRYLRAADIARFLLQHRQRMDVVCLLVYGGPSFIVEDIASWLVQRTGQPLILWLHGGAMPDFMARWPGWTRRVLCRARAIVTPSAFLARSLVNYGFQAQVIPNVLTIGKYSYRNRSTLQPKLFWMRTFHPVYNPDLAIRVLARIRQIDRRAMLTMAGQDDGYLQATRELAASLRVDDVVRFVGFLGGAAKDQEAARHDIFLNTNRIDNMPLAVIEAGAWGLPVVSTRVGGLPDLLEDGQTGLLVPDDNVDAMAEAVLRLMAEPELASRLSENGRKLAETCSWAQVRPRWEALLAEVVLR